MAILGRSGRSLGRWVVVPALFLFVLEAGASTDPGQTPLSPPPPETRSSLALALGSGLLGGMAFSFAADIFHGDEVLAGGSGFLLSAVPTYLLLDRSSQWASRPFVLNTLANGAWGAFLGDSMAHALFEQPDPIGLYRLGGELLGVGLGFFQGSTATEAAVVRRNLGGLLAVGATQGLLFLTGHDDGDRKTEGTWVTVATLAALVPAHLFAPEAPYGDRWYDLRLGYHTFWGGIFGGLLVPALHSDDWNSFAGDGVIVGAGLAYLTALYLPAPQLSDPKSLLALNVATGTSTLGGLGLGTLLEIGEERASALGASLGLLTHVGTHLRHHDRTPPLLAPNLFAEWFGLLAGAGLAGTFLPEDDTHERRSLGAGLFTAALLSNGAHFLPELVPSTTPGFLPLAATDLTLGASLALGTTLWTTSSRRMHSAALFGGALAGTALTPLIFPRATLAPAMFPAGVQGTTLGLINGFAFSRAVAETRDERLGSYLVAVPLSLSLFLTDHVLDPPGVLEHAATVSNSLWGAWISGWSYYTLTGRSDSSTFLAAVLGADLGALFSLAIFGDMLAVAPTSSLTTVAGGVLGVMMGASLVDLGGSEVSRWTLLGGGFLGMAAGALISPSVTLRHPPAALPSTSPQPFPGHAPSAAPAPYWYPVITPLLLDEENYLMLGVGGHV